MKKLMILASLPLALSACSTASTLETGVVPAANFSPLENANDVFASPRLVMEYYLKAVDRDEPTKQEIGVYPGSSGDRLLLFTAENLEDDSVSAMQWRVVLDQTDVGLRVVGAGVRQQCARSGSDEWTNAPCP